MDEMPRTTLTQRRNDISSGNLKKITTKDNTTNSTPPVSGSPTTPGESSIDRSAMLRILVWIVAIVFIGIGAALFLTNMLTNNRTEPDQNVVTEVPESSPVSSPVADDPEDEPAEVVDEAPDEDPVVDLPSVASIDEFDDTSRSLEASTPGNNLIFNNFRFGPAGDVFNYQFYNVSTSSGPIDPEVKLFYTGSDLVVEFHNVRRDNVTGSNNQTSRDINGVNGVRGTETQNQGNISRYKFLMDQPLPSRVLVDSDSRQITIQIELPN